MGRFFSYSSFRKTIFNNIHMKNAIQIRSKILEIDKKIHQIEKSVGMCSIDEAFKKAEIIEGYRDIRRILEWVLS